MRPVTRPHRRLDYLYLPTPSRRSPAETQLLKTKMRKFLVSLTVSLFSTRWDGLLDRPPQSTVYSVTDSWCRLCSRKECQSKRRFTPISDFSTSSRLCLVF